MMRDGLPSQALVDREARRRIREKGERLNRALKAREAMTAAEIEAEEEALRAEIEDRVAAGQVTTCPLFTRSRREVRTLYNHHFGKLPTTRNRHGRIRSDDALTYEAASVIRAVIAQNRRYAAAGGISIDHRWAMAHLDDDEVLTVSVMSSAGLTRHKDGSWVWRRGMWPLAQIADLNVLGDTLVTLVDHHRPT